MTRVSVVGVLLAAAAAGCGADGPPVVRYGAEECAHCRMIVNDDRFAAAVVLPTGEARKFDEVGCLIDFLKGQPDAKGVWVRGYRTGAWHDARQAFFVHGPKLHTPMGSGLAAVPARADADALAAELGGRVLRFDELSGFLESKAAEGAAGGCPNCRPGEHE